MGFTSDKLVNLVKSLSPDPKKAGKTLLYLNALGMVFAAASNTAAAAIDKNTSAEDKKFLIPAGVATGVANIGIYFLMTKKIMDGLEKSAKSFVDKMDPKELSKKAVDFAERTIKKTEQGLFKKTELAQSMKQNFFKDGKITEVAINLYKDNVKAASSVAGAFIGAVIGCSILTPLIRDIGAYFIQKKMEKKNPELAEKPYRPYYDPSRVGTGIYNRRQPLSMTNFMAYAKSGGKNGMKI